MSDLLLQLNTILQDMTDLRNKTPDFGPMRHIAILAPEGMLENCCILSGQKGKDRQGL